MGSVTMSDSDSDSPPPGKRDKALASFLGISVGNILIFLGMLGTGLLGIYQVGGEVRGLQDAVTHEQEQRANTERELTSQISNVQREASNSVLALQRQETTDVGNINSNIQDMRNDMRTLMQASGRRN